MEYKSYFGLTTLVIGIFSYSLYFRDIFRHKTKPHAMSWLVWGILNSVIFLTQRSNGAGSGSWITAFSATVALLIFATSLRYGEKEITRLDWYCLTGAAVTLLLWYTQQHGLGAVILASLTFVLGFAPTFRKAYYKPRQETMATFALNGTKFLIAIFALNHLTTTTILYPGTIVIMNFCFVLLLSVRRTQV